MIAEARAALESGTPIPTVVTLYADRAHRQRRLGSLRQLLVEFDPERGDCALTDYLRRLERQRAA